MAETLKNKTPEKLKRLTDTSKYDDIGLLLLCSELPLSPEGKDTRSREENDKLTTIISATPLLSTSFEGLFKYINLQKKQGKKGEELLKGILQQVDFHSQLSSLNDQNEQMKNLFPIKSVGLLLVSSFIRSLSKIDSGLSLDDLKMVSLDIGNYQTFYSVYRKVDVSRYILGEDIALKILRDLESEFQKPHLDMPKIVSYGSGTDRFLQIYESSQKALLKNSRFSVWISEGKLRSQEPYKKFLELFLIHYTRYQYIKNSGLSDSSQLSLTLEEMKSIVKAILKDFPFEAKLFEYDLVLNLSEGKSFSIKNFFSKNSNIPKSSVSQENTPKAPKVFVPQDNSQKISEVNEEEKFQGLLSELFTQRDFPQRLSFNHTKRHNILPTSRSLATIIGDISSYPQYKEKIYQTLLKELPIGHKQSLEVLKIFFSKKILTSQECYKVLEGKSGFQKGGVTLSETIRAFGFSDRLTQAFESILGTKLDLKKSRNIMKFFEYFLFMESSGGYNVTNYTGESSAQGYFQYLTKNGRQGGEVLDPVSKKYVNFQPGNRQHVQWKKQNINSFRSVWRDNSYETALRRIPGESLQHFGVFTSERTKIGKPHLQSPKSLTSEEQMLLFFADIYKKAPLSIDQLLVSGDTRFIEQAYEAHHTNTSGDIPTKKRMQIARTKVSEEYS